MLSSRPAAASDRSRAGSVAHDRHASPRGVTEVTKFRSRSPPPVVQFRGSLADARPLHLATVRCRSRKRLVLMQLPTLLRGHRACFPARSGGSSCAENEVAERRTSLRSAITRFRQRSPRAHGGCSRRLARLRRSRRSGGRGCRLFGETGTAVSSAAGTLIVPISLVDPTKSCPLLRGPATTAGGRRRLRCAAASHRPPPSNSSGSPTKRVQRCSRSAGTWRSSHRG